MIQLQALDDNKLASTNPSQGNDGVPSTTQLRERSSLPSISLPKFSAIKSDYVNSLKAIRNHVIEKVSALENLGRIKSQTTATPKEADSNGVSDILVYHFSQNNAIVHHCIPNEDLNILNESLEKFWSLDAVPITLPLTKAEEECELHFQSTYSRTLEGQYVVRYPFKSGPPINIGLSRKTAEKALSSLLKRFNANSDLFEQYDKFMGDYENLGHMSRVSDPPLDSSQVVYLTHHHVIRASNTKAVRGVFNASRLTSNFTSLNDHMHIGPKLQTNFFEVVLQWRTFKFVYAADIAKMYRQILIDEKDRDYQRILWTPKSAAPFLALRVLRQLVKDEGSQHPKGSAVLNQQIYIDDCLFGADSEDEIIDIREDVEALLKKGHFKLRKWASNSILLLEDIDKQEHALAVEKRLDESDSLKKLWVRSISWDEPLPEDVASYWNTYGGNLSKLDTLSIPRWTGQGNNVVDSSIHGFSDASNSAYAAVAYLRLVLDSGEIRIVLLSSRTKVAPIKTQSIPRLELCAWLNKHASSWKTFVANRVAAIQAEAPFANWNHVSTKDNPADLASRGILTPEFAESKLWWHGPSWLSQLEEFWPKKREFQNFETELGSCVRAHHVHNQIEFCLDNLSNQISSCSKLVRILAYILKFLDIKVGFSPAKIRNKDDATFVEYCIESEIIWIRYIQAKLFLKEIYDINEKVELNRGNPLLPLNPFVDGNKILRVGGRLAHANLEFDRKFPIILKAHPVVTLIIRHVHEKCLHGGTQLTLSLIRQKFWIIRGRQNVKSVIYNCMSCVRLRAEVSNQLMAALPKSRITRPGRPFTHVGIDYACPVKITIHRGRSYTSHSAYIAVFVCFAVRAIHLEPVSDYSTEAFLAALKRFMSRRGLPHTIHSDRGTNFQGANRELKETFREVTQSPEVKAYLINDKIRWDFIPPAAPHFEGIWEAGVRSVKHHLRRVLGVHTPTFEELATLLCQIESCLNSRPLCPLSDDPEDLKVLTLAHFLIGGELTAVPKFPLENVRQNRLSRWQLWQQLLEVFWKAWSKDYILSSHQRNKWQLRKKELCVGQIVLVKDECLPPTKWALGRNINIKRSSDDLVREVTVHTASGTYVRPITKLALLPVDSQSNDWKLNFLP
ncbi:uncharacterized protein LOC117171146 [Belonocnema kinseyi]|uniref:uncharacterized protein LOC117171146 n=1 Tax=Belonocnema kinseyi TaxID=2817044 RepID=UPI00143DD287|nr:uncharacterized protein LOC117171146 [Belonocnema kinseyi]